MTIIVNGEPHELSAAMTVAELVHRLGRNPDQPGTAIARNGDLVPRRLWRETALDDGDAVEVVTAVGGG